VLERPITEVTSAGHLGAEGPRAGTLHYNLMPPRRSTRTINVDGVALELAIERKKGVKNVNARLTGSTLSVSAPFGMPQEALDEIVLKLAGRLLRRAHASMLNEADDALKLAREVAKRFPKEPSIQRVMFVTTQRKRWGSYSTRTKTVRLNAAVRWMPRWVLEAVVAHELAHTFHADHSRAFWDLLRRVCPETERAEAFLAGVSWLAHNRKRLPKVEREILGTIGECPEDARHCD
jgi:predicted metal-dependent hydrolase